MCNDKLEEANIIIFKVMVEFWTLVQLSEAWCQQNIRLNSTKDREYV